MPLNDAVLERVTSLWKEIPEGPGIDDAARTYARSMHGHPYAHYRSLVEVMGLRGNRMLDAGCGTGTWSFPFAEFFDRVDGVDISEPRIAVAKAMAEQFGTENIHFSVGDALALPYEDGAFDLVFCYSVVISYIPIRSLLAEFARVLKPGGRVFTVLNGYGWSLHQRDVRAKDGEKYLIGGQRGLYNTIVQMRPEIAPERFDAVKRAFAENAALTKVRKIDHWTGTPDELFAQLGQPALSEVAGEIERECGADYVRTFADDIIRIATGSRDQYSHNRAGRGYEPHEVEKALADVGFGDFRWAQEGRMFSPGRDKYPRGNLYQDRLTTWEFMATKS